MNEFKYRAEETRENINIIFIIYALFNAIIIYYIKLLHQVFIVYQRFNIN
jgi:hypothetical protein